MKVPSSSTAGLRPSRLMLPAALAVVVAVAVGVALWHSRRPVDAGALHGREGATAQAGPARQGPGRAESPAERLRATAALVQELADKAAAPVRLGAAQVVATVNGVPIRGVQVVAFHAGEPAEQAMNPTTYEFLRQRAIERELTVQAARALGVALLPTQLEQLKEARRFAGQRGVTDPAQLDFEQEDARAQMLQTALLARTGAPGPLAGEADVERYYQTHRDEFDELPADPAARATALQKIRIDIRQLLAEEFQKKHQERLREYLDQLRSQARITA